MIAGTDTNSYSSYDSDIVEKIATDIVVSSDGMQIRGFKWSPDGESIAYVACVDEATRDCSLVVDNKMLSDPVPIKTDEIWQIWDWQTNGILFTKDKEAGKSEEYYGDSEAWLIQPDGTDETQLTYTFSNGVRTEYWNEYWDNGTVRWAKLIPESNLLHFKAHNGNGWYRTFVCNADGSDNWYDLSAPSYSWRAEVSPMGDKLFFSDSANYDTPITIWSADIDGGNRFEIAGPMPMADFFVLRGGGRITYVEDNTVFVIDTNGENLRRVQSEWNEVSVSGPGRDENEVLAIDRLASGNRRVLLVNVEDGQVTALTDGADVAGQAAFSPTESLLAYQRWQVDDDGESIGPYELVVIEVAR